MLQLGEETLDQVALSVEQPAEAWLPAPVTFGWNIGRSAMLLDQLPDAVGVIGFVRQHDSARAEMVEQRFRNLPIMCLPGGQAETDREPLRVNGRNFNRASPVARKSPLQDGKTGVN